MAERHYEQACKAFEDSQRRDPQLSTLLNLADCREKMGAIATAWRLFLQVAEETRNGQDTAINQVARERAAGLEARLSFVTITVPHKSRVDGLAIFVDGNAIETSRWGLPFPVDGGSHELRATAPGHVAAHKQLLVPPEKGQLSVAFPEAPLERESAVPVRDARVENVAIAAPPSAETAPPSRTAGRTRRRIALGTAVAAGVLLGAGTWAGLSAKDKRDDARAAGCNADLTQCPMSTIGLAEDAHSLGNVSTGLFIGGTAMVGAAVVLWLSSGSENSSRSTAWRAMPHVSGHHAELVFGRMF